MTVTHVGPHHGTALSIIYSCSHVYATPQYTPYPSLRYFSMMALTNLVASRGNRAHRDGLDSDQALTNGFGPGHQTGSGRVGLGNSRAVLQTVGALAARNDDVANTFFEGSVGVADGLGVGLDLADAALDVLVVDGNDRLLRKVLLLRRAAVVVGDGRVLVVGVDPGLAVGEWRAVLGVKGVRVKRVARLVDKDCDFTVAVHLDIVARAAGGPLAGQGNDVADKLAHADGQPAKELRQVLFAQGRVLVAAKDPGLALAVVVVDVEGADVERREAGALGEVLAVAREVLVVPVVRGVRGDFQGRHQVGA